MAAARAARLQAFPDAVAFGRWLSRHHASRTELLLRCFKVHARHRGLTYSDALDEALCWGWIDGVRRAVDADSFSVRFTPRLPTSAWSAVNVRRFAALRKAGRARAPGLAAYAAGRRTGYSYESRPAALAPALERHFRRRRGAWRFYASRPPWYRRASAFWVMSAKRDETRERRLAQLIECSGKGETIPPLTRAGRTAGRRPVRKK